MNISPHMALPVTPTGRPTAAAWVRDSVAVPCTKKACQGLGWGAGTTRSTGQLEPRTVRAASEVSPAGVAGTSSPKSFVVVSSGVEMPRGRHTPALIADSIVVPRHTPSSRVPDTRVSGTKRQLLACCATATPFSVPTSRHTPDAD